jgi:hypothetical protein
VFVVAAVMLAVGACWAAFQWGWHRGGVANGRLSADNERLSRQVATLRRQVVQLREDGTRLQSFRRIDEQATKQVRESLNQLQRENMELREQLQFYRNIVSPSKGKTGLNIQNFKLDQGPGDNQYHYKLTLIHVPESKGRRRLARGVVELTAEGKQGGVPVRLSMVQITRPKVEHITFAIKYFKQFDGSIVLPAGFTPGTVVVHVVPKGAGKTEELEQKIEWPLTAE